MTDFHHNIFYYYRGSHSSKQWLYDKQLEDNTTKALVNTLKHCSPLVALKFLKWLGIAANQKHIEVELQKPTIGTEKIHHTSQRLLLGLVDKPENIGDSICTQLDGRISGDSRPDAWIYGEDFVVLIESKVGKDQLEFKQMQYHFRKLQKNAPNPPKCKVLTWAEVHKFFAGLLPELRDKDKWLVEQLTQYLEWQGMSEFVGFEEGMFEFFVHDDKDADTKKWIRNTMGLFAEKVLSQNGLQTLNAMFYMGYHVGNFGAADDHFWVAFGPEKFRKIAHQTIALYDYGLDIFVNVELLPAIKKLRTKVRYEKQKFRTIISELPEPFTVQVEERKQKKVRKFDQYVITKLEGGIYKDYHSETYGLKDPQSIGFDYLEMLLEQIKLPYLSIRKRINRKQVLDLSKREGALVDEVLAIMREFHPLVEFING